MIIHQSDLVGAGVSLGIAAFSAGFLYWSIKSKEQDFATILCQTLIGVLGLLSFIWGSTVLILWFTGATILP